MCVMQEKYAAVRIFFQRRLAAKLGGKFGSRTGTSERKKAGDGESFLTRRPPEILGRLLQFYCGDDEPAAFLAWRCSRASAAHCVRCSGVSTAQTFARVDFFSALSWFSLSVSLRVLSLLMALIWSLASERIAAIWVFWSSVRFRAVSVSGASGSILPAWADGAAEADWARKAALAEETEALIANPNTRARQLPIEKSLAVFM